MSEPQPDLLLYLSEDASFLTRYTAYATIAYVPV